MMVSWGLTPMEDGKIDPSAMKRFFDAVHFPVLVDDALLRIGSHPAGAERMEGGDLHIGALDRDLVEVLKSRLLRDDGQGPEPRNRSS
jgi:hypothetical protein